jgi:hypothetical protein
MNLLNIALLWWDYLEGGSKSMADCLNFDPDFEIGKIYSILSILLRAK